MKNVRQVADVLETAGRRDSRERPAATRRVWCRQPGVYFSPCDSNHDVFRHRRGRRRMGEAGAATTLRFSRREFRTRLAGEA
jgi:hypothetical protein